MSGRGKGGKGLGKGGAKRHRKILRDNIQVSIYLNFYSVRTSDLNKFLRVLQNQLLDVLLVVVVLNVFQV